MFAVLCGIVVFTTAVVAGASVSPKIVAFTFDDGPRPEFLVSALPYFAAEHIPATFFVVGTKAKAHPQWIKRAFGDGHEIENHTMNHVCLAKPSPAWTACASISAQNAIREILLADDVIEGLTGYRTRFLRPPYFAMTDARRREIEQALGVRVLLHGKDSIGSLDWVYRDPERIADKVIRTVKARGAGPYVIVFHENAATLEALPRIVAHFRLRGYAFVRLDEFVRQAPLARI